MSLLQGKKEMYIKVVDCNIYLKKEDIKQIGFEFDAYEHFKLRIRHNLWMKAELDSNWENVERITMYMEKTDAYVLKEKKSDCIADESTYKTKVVGYSETANELSDLIYLTTGTSVYWLKNK
jgi:hypothetical protein